MPRTLEAKIVQASNKLIFRSLSLVLNGLLNLINLTVPHIPLIGSKAELYLLVQNRGTGMQIDPEKAGFEIRLPDGGLTKRTTLLYALSPSFLFHHEMYADCSFLKVVYVIEVTASNTSQSIPTCVQIQDIFSILEDPMTLG
jgi:hypothetical protein